MKVTRPLHGDMILLSFAVTAMYALLGVPPPVPFLPVRQSETDSLQGTSDSNINSPCDSNQERQGKKQTKSRLSITKKDQLSTARKGSRESHPSPKSTTMSSKGWNPIGKGKGIKGSLDSPQSSPQMRANKFRRQGDALDHGDQAKKTEETPRKSTKELANKSSSSLDGRRLHSCTGTTVLVNSSAQERSRLAYEKKIQQLSARTNNSAATKEKCTPVRPRGKDSNATPKTESLRNPNAVRNTPTSSDRSGKTGVATFSCEEPTRLASKLNCFTRLLGRSFSASCAVPAEVPKQKLTSSPKSTSSRTTPKQWRSIGVVRSHSLGDTPTTPVTHRDKGRLQTQLEAKKTVRSTVRVAGREDVSKTGLPARESPPVSQATVGPTCYHICFYYAISFLVFVFIQMYEAYFGGNLFQLLANSRRYC